MAFNTATSTNKNQFVLRLVSRRTGDTASWVNLTESFCNKVFGKEIKNITPAEALEKLPPYYESKYLALEITDLTAEKRVIDITEF